MRWEGFYWATYRYTVARTQIYNFAKLVKLKWNGHIVESDGFGRYTGASIKRGMNTRMLNRWRRLPGMHVFYCHSLSSLLSARGCVQYS